MYPRLVIIIVPSKSLTTICNVRKSGAEKYLDFFYCPNFQECFVAPERESLQTHNKQPSYIFFNFASHFNKSITVSRNSLMERNEVCTSYNTKSILLENIQNESNLSICFLSVDNY